PNCTYISVETWVYDSANGNRLASYTNANGNRTEFLYSATDERRPIQQIEAAGTPQARTVDYRWHPKYDVKTFVGEAARETTDTYDDLGRLQKRIIGAAP